MVIVFSGSVAAQISGLPSSIALTSCPASTPSSFNVGIADQNGNALAGGTTVSVATTNGTITTPTTFTIPDSAARSPFNFLLTLQTDATLSGGVCTNATSVGNLTITARSPSGIVTTKVIPVTD